MDNKLARGHLREGFRRDLKGVDGVQDALAQVHRPYIERLQSRGKLSKSEAKEALVRVSAFKSDPHHTVFLERFTRGGIKSVSPNFDGAIVGGNFSSGPVTLFGHEEKVRSYSLFYDRYSNKGIEMRLMERPIYVREHAIGRFIERANSSFTSVTASLWPGLLLIDAFQYFGTPAVARVFMLPVPQGAFLGIAAMSKPPNDIRGVERATIDVSGIKENVDASSIEPLIPIWFLNTFVSTEELKTLQCELRAKLIAQIERHRAVLMVAHLGRIMSIENNPEDLGLELRFPGDVHAAKADFDGLFSSDLWLRAIRLPNDSPFVNHFVAQGLLERSNVEFTH
jgi:hypothetical protein